jgi:hypothetical protein
MTTKATRDVLDMAVRPVQNFILDGTGVSRIDSTPIGTITPDVGFFTNLQATNFTVTGVATFTGATVVGLSSYYADIAECYEADRVYAPGTVVKIGGTKEITATTDDADEDVFGVISSDPAYVLNQQHDSGHEGGIYLPVALIGRVPCRVVGPVHKGDRLLATVEGLARALDKSTDAPHVVSFARSLVTNLDEGDRLVEVAIVTVK